jgi:hypothetical protein
MDPDPVKAEAGANFADNVAVCPAVNVNGTVIPDAENPVPAVVI